MFIPNYFMDPLSPNKADILYVLTEVTYDEFVSAFAKNGIIISGGSSVKRHIISPVQFRLQLYVQAILNFDYRHLGKVANSFNYYGNSHEISRISSYNPIHNNKNNENVKQNNENTSAISNISSEFNNTPKCKVFLNNKREYSTLTNKKSRTNKNTRINKKDSFIFSYLDSIKLIV